MRCSVNMRLAFLCGLVAAALALPALAQDDGLVVYNAQHEALTQEWADGFSKETGIKVTLRNGSDTELGNQLLQEGAASPADLFLTENSPAQVLVDNAGLFEKLPQDILDEVPPAYRPSSGNWIGIAARSTVFAYNTDLLKPDQLPKSIMDLAKPEWKGRWAASPSGADFQAIVAAMLSLKGEQATADWLKAMKDNAVAYRGNTAAMKGVNAGEVQGAVIYHYYYFGDKAKTGENSNKVALHFFKGQDPGAFVSTSGGAVLKSSKHKAEALAFLKWIAGKGGQDVLKTGTSYEYAVGVDAESNPALPPLSSLEAPTVDASGLDSKKVTELMTAAGLI
ncbi:MULTISPECIES: iron ABC transporter substrate-binding protein [unclassified Devosia]|uniref:iron ABC transporter substrate-binding protein n=1 Tax=unclassified Devosia TaxID=196773 RepID=UPI001ACB7671|nr:MULTISPECIES: iron ABC transporter substrate-binding protein [unclassified Devosia]MBN9304007.1 iron ABC transporter substrate-binding protein [Devosia sp.]